MSKPKKNNQPVAVECIESRLSLKKELSELGKKTESCIANIKKQMTSMLDESSLLAASEDFLMLNNILDMAISQSIIINSMSADLAKLPPDDIDEYRGSVSHTLGFVIDSVALMEKYLVAP